MARELRKAARDSGEDVAAHHGLVKMIAQWERGNRAIRERYRLLYLKVFEDMLDGLPHGTDAWIWCCGWLRSAGAQPGCRAPARSRQHRLSTLPTGLLIHAYRVVKFRAG